MGQETLKELLKFPLIVLSFTSDKNEIYAAVQYPRNYSYLGNELQEWIQQALNEKMEQEINEPLCWKRTSSVTWFQCPNCKEEEQFPGPVISTQGFYKYCPHCGRRLNPPEEDTK